MESEWRYNVWRIGQSGPGPILGFGPLTLTLVARLITPIVVSSLAYQWLILWRYPAGFSVFLGRSPVNDYVEQSIPFFPPGSTFPFGLGVHPD